MLYKRLKSVVLLSLFLSSNCYAAVEQEDSDKYNLVSTIKYSTVTLFGIFAAASLAALGRNYLLDKILEKDLKNDLECNIIRYLDGDKISLTKDEIRRYSDAYNSLLSKLDKDDEVKKEKVYDKLKACALFLIRTDARLRRKNKKLTNNEIDDDVKRYQRGTRECILSKSCFENNSGKIWERYDYLNYIYANYKLKVVVGPDGPYGWIIGFNPRKLFFEYENCKPI